MLKLAVLSISFVLLSAMAINGILPEIRDALAITQTQSELLVTIPSIATLIFVILSDRFISKIGMKKTVLLGLMLSGIGGIMPLFNSNSYSYILISRFIFGAGKGLIFTPSVGYINILFKENERATLIGFRSAVEMLGQAILTLTIGALAIFSWHLSFITNIIFFIIAGLVAWKIPEVETNSNLNSANNLSQDNAKIPLIIFPLAVFVGIVAISGSMIAVRFPAMAAEIRGDGYNSSIWVAIKPLLGIIAAVFFGKLNAILGKRLLFIGVALLITAQMMIGFSNGNFAILVIGFQLSAFVLGWVVPIIINTISRITTGKQQRLSTALVLICANVGIFFMPFIVRGLEIIAGSTELTAPYPLMGILITTILITILLTSNNKTFRVKVGLENA